MGIVTTEDFLISSFFLCVNPVSHSRVHEYRCSRNLTDFISVIVLSLSLYAAEYMKNPDKQFQPFLEWVLVASVVSDSLQPHGL